MKKIIPIAVACLMWLTAAPLAFAEASPGMSNAGGAILIEGETGRVLAEKDPDAQLPMASTTKVMTAILAIENGNMDDIITVSENASGIEGSSIWLAAGEHVRFEDLLYGLMLTSGNDAAVAIAEYIAGSVDAFVEMMNEKAAELGAVNTHFVTVNGLHDDEHYTTAADLAAITAYAMKNETFRKIVSTDYWEMPWEGHEYNRVLKNKNRNLWEYEGATGVKTGYTTDSGRCFVTSAKRDGMELICVLLDDYEMFADSRTIMDYGFTNYSMLNIINDNDIVGDIQVTNGLSETVEAVIDGEFSYPCSAEERSLIEKEIVYAEKLEAPVKAGETIGNIKVSLNGETLYTADIVTADSVGENTYEYNLGRVIRDFLFG